MIYNGKLIKMTEYIRNTLVFLFFSVLMLFNRHFRPEVGDIERKISNLT